MSKNQRKVRRKMNKILITGGEGYIGSVLVPMLLKMGYKVVSFDNLHNNIRLPSPYHFHPNYKFIKGDITNPTSVAEVINETNFIIHLAAIVGYPACKKNPELARKVNIEGIRILIKNRVENQPIIIASTQSSYGFVENGFYCEETPLNPTSLYGKIKAIAENLVLESGNAISFRLATAFGLSPNLRLDLLVNYFVFQALKKKVSYI